MKLVSPERYVLTCPSRRFAIREALQGLSFTGKAASRGPKLYVIGDHKSPVYVGITRQPIASRLRYGWSADGTHGYHGYAWRKCFKTITLDVWYLDQSSTKRAIHWLETVEAEVVFLLRKRGQWPAFQTEIHFHPSDNSHRLAAAGVLAVYLRQPTTP